MTRLVIREERFGHCQFCARRMKIEQTFVLQPDETVMELEERARSWQPVFEHRACAKVQQIDGQMSLFGEES